MSKQSYIRQLKERITFNEDAGNKNFTGTLRARLEQMEKDEKPPRHTPGPWFRDEKGFIAAGPFEIHVTMADDDCSEMDTFELAANKDLVATTPTLLDAINEIDLKVTQTRVANKIGKSTKTQQIKFLLGELERIQGICRDSLSIVNKQTTHIK